MGTRCSLKGGTQTWKMSLLSPFTWGIPFSNHPQEIFASSLGRMGHIPPFHLIQAPQSDYLWATKDPSSMNRLPLGTHIKSGSASQMKGEWMLGKEIDIFSCSEWPWPSLLTYLDLVLLSLKKLLYIEYFLCQGRYFTCIFHLILTTVHSC